MGHARFALAFRSRQIVAHAFLRCGATAQFLEHAAVSLQVAEHLIEKAEFAVQTELSPFRLLGGKPFKLLLFPMRAESPTHAILLPSYNSGNQLLHTLEKILPIWQPV